MICSFWFCGLTCVCLQVFAWNLLDWPVRKIGRTYKDSCRFLLDIFHWAKILLSNNNFNWTPCRDSCSNILFFSLAFSGADLYFTLPQTNSFLKNSECDPEFMYESGYDPTWATARSASNCWLRQKVPGGWERLPRAQWLPLRSAARALAHIFHRCPGNLFRGPRAPPAAAARAPHYRRLRALSSSGR